MKKDLKSLVFGIVFLACCVYIVRQLIVDPHFMIGQFATCFLVLAGLRFVSAVWYRKRYRDELTRQVLADLASDRIRMYSGTEEFKRYPNE